MGRLGLDITFERGKASKSSIRFKGEWVSRQDTLDTISKFDVRYPDTNNFTGQEGLPRQEGLKGWLENRAFKYAVWHEGRLYPPKYILSKASDVPRCVFQGGSQTNAVFRRLGSKVIDKTRPMARR